MKKIIWLYFIVVLSLTVSSKYQLSAAIIILGTVFCYSIPINAKINSQIALPQPTAPIHNKRMRIFIYFVIIIMGTLVYWLAFFPGGYNLDASGQWMQAHGKLHYNDWHPIFSTLLFQLCAIIYDSFSFVILIQVFTFSLACAILLSTLNQCGVPEIVTLFVSLYLSLNPAIGLNTISMTKDVQFTFFMILLVDIMIRSFASEGAWFSEIWHCLYCVVIGVCACLVRHNGIFFVFPAILLMLLQNKSDMKKTILIILACAFCFIGIKGFLFRHLNVEPHENPVGETIGIPMAILANALVNDPENIPDKTYEFLNAIAPDEDWQEHYIIGEWDSCKWIMPGVENLECVPLGQILHYTFQTIIACPETSYESFKENTSIVWQPYQTPWYWIPDVYIEEDEYMIEPKPIPFFRDIASALIQLSQMFPANMFCWNTGMQILLIMLAFLIAPGKRYANAAFLYVPLLTYDFGTMLFLAGPNQRYFYCNAVLFLPIILTVLYKRGNV